jgi:hypothetical protein
MSGSSSVAERQLPKLNVAGSIPVSRSSPSQIVTIQFDYLNYGSRRLKGVAQADANPFFLD